MAATSPRRRDAATVHAASDSSRPTAAAITAGPFPGRRPMQAPVTERRSAYRCRSGESGTTTAGTPCAAAERVQRQDHRLQLRRRLRLRAEVDQVARPRTARSLPHRRLRSGRAQCGRRRLGRLGRHLGRGPGSPPGDPPREHAHSSRRGRRDYPGPAEHRDVVAHGLVPDRLAVTQVEDVNLLEVDLPPRRRHDLVHGTVLEQDEGPGMAPPHAQPPPHLPLVGDGPQEGQSQALERGPHPRAGRRHTRWAGRPARRRRHGHLTVPEFLAHHLRGQGGIPCFEDFEKTGGEALCGHSHGVDAPPGHATGARECGGLPNPTLI